MALKFPKFDFSRLDARTRILLLVAGVALLFFLVYLGTRFFLGGGETTGPTRVAQAPAGLESVPGGELTPEYYRALQQANIEAARQAQIRGEAAVPTLVRVDQPQAQPSTAQCIICPNVTEDVKYSLDDWVKQGKISPEVADQLQQLADKNVSPEEYAAMLDRLVKEGKLTPEQARELLEKYKKQHANRLLQESAKTMDDLIKSGQLPLDAANQLLELQKKKVSPAEYAAELERLVREGKISPELAQQLLAQYAQQRAREIIKQSISVLQKMARAGEITPEVEKTLIDLESRIVPLAEFATTLSRLVSEGKMTPAVANKIQQEYLQQKKDMGSAESIQQLVKKAEAAAIVEINDLLKSGQISPDVASLLLDLIRKNVSLREYQETINQLVQQNKLTPAIAKLKMADYQTIKGLRDTAQRLGALAADNASTVDYMNELKRAVQAGILTPEEAARLMQEYQALTAPVAAAPGAPSAVTDEFARLQQQVRAGAGVAVQPTTDQFAAAEAAAAVETAEQRQQRIEALMAAMSSQSQQLVSAWQPPTMLHQEGSGADGKAKREATTGTSAEATKEKATSESAEALTKPALIKAGTILFAVLETAVNSDYPDTPVMATIVTGDLKGAKLLGKLNTAKNPAGQLDRVSLTFNLMNMDAWPKSKTINAFAIDPDTARTVMASDVDYHYLKRFGAMMATSFVQGYSNAITQAGTSTTGIFGTSSTHAALSPQSKIAVGIGQIGQTLGNATQNYINIPPTVKVDSGVSLGILFMSDVS